MGTDGDAGRACGIGCSVAVSPLGKRWGLSPVGSNFRTALAGAIIILHRNCLRSLSVGSNLLVWEEPVLTCAARVCFLGRSACVEGAGYHRLGGGYKTFRGKGAGSIEFR